MFGSEPGVARRVVAGAERTGVRGGRVDRRDGEAVAGTPADAPQSDVHGAASVGTSDTAAASDGALGTGDSSGAASDAGTLEAGGACPLGCAVTPRCGEPCEDPCGCCTCVEGERTQIDGALHACVAGCFAPIDERTTAAEWSMPTVASVVVLDDQLRATVLGAAYYGGQTPLSTYVSFSVAAGTATAASGLSCVIGQCNFGDGNLPP